MSKKEDIVQDQTADVADRAAALMAKQFNAATTTGSAMPQVAEMQLPPGVARTNARMIPSIQDLYKGAEHLFKDHRTGTEGDMIESGPEPSAVIIKRFNEPNDLYEDPQLAKETGGAQGRIPANLVNLLYMFLLNGFVKEVVNPETGEKKKEVDRVRGQDYINRIGMTAAGRGVAAHTLIRQRLWDIMFNKRVNLGTLGVPSDRSADDDNDGQDPYRQMTLDNQRLYILLGGSNFNALQDVGRLFNCANKTAFVALVTGAVDKVVL